MNKKILSLLLVLSLLLPLFPVRAEAQEIVTDDSLKDLIAQQFDAFAATLHPEGASEAATEMVKHSMATTAAWHMTTNDLFAQGLFSTKLIRADFIEIVVAAHTTLSKTHDRSMFLRGSCDWYDGDSKYSNTAYSVFTDNNDNSDDVTYKPITQIRRKEYTGPINVYDESMMLVVGSSNLNTTLDVTSVTPTEVTYHVTLIVKDVFDFNNLVYKGSDRGLETFLSWAGKLLSFGLLNTFAWSATAEFDITLPNRCTHESGNYRWEFDGVDDMVNVEGEGLQANTLTRLEQDKYEPGNGFNYIYYSTYAPVRLYHDRPWVIEFQAEGKGSFALAQDKTVANGYHFRRSANTTFFGEVYKVNPTDEKNTYFYYGYKIQKKIDGIVYADLHTYRLENRIAEDGSNMVWLLIDGVEISAMNNHFLNSKDQETTVDWVNGKDFVFNYVGNASYPFKDISVPYIQIWENGINGGQFSYLVSETVDATCTEAGYVTRTCTLCGAVFENETVEPTGHSFSEWQVFAEPTCAQTGLRYRTCVTCGTMETEEIPTESHSFTVTATTQPDCVNPGFATEYCTACGYTQNRETDPALGHTVVIDAANPATCTEPGLTEGSHCVTCGTILTAQETIPALGHAWDEGAIITAPTIWQEGEMRYACTTCGETRTEIIPPIPHTHEYGEWETTVEPTSKQEGEQRRSCDCGLYESQPIPKLENPFVDLDESIFYFEPVLWAVYKEITAGTGADTFAPYQTCTRAQVVTFLWRAMGKPEPESEENPFTDVPEHEWYYKAVLWAMENGITSGTGTDTFSPDDSCTRAQVVTFLWRAMGREEPESAENPFRDVRSDAYYYIPVLWAVENGITSGTRPDTFSPDASCNRGQVVTFLYRALAEQ